MSQSIAFLFPAFPVLHRTSVPGEVPAPRCLGVEIELNPIEQPRATTQQACRRSGAGMSLS
jgi:hypothetical protein